MTIKCQDCGRQMYFSAQCADYICPTCDKQTVIVNNLIDPEKVQKEGKLMKLKIEAIVEVEKGSKELNERKIIAALEGQTANGGEGEEDYAFIILPNSVTIIGEIEEKDASAGSKVDVTAGSDKVASPTAAPDKGGTIDTDK